MCLITQTVSKTVRGVSAGYTLPMRLVLNAAEDAAHLKWLRETPGAYEWWYYDARSDCGTWAIACIWFLGNPFSPYYRLAALGKAADPLAHNALFFALYREGRLHAYHFTRFPRGEVEAPTLLPGTLRLGPNVLTLNSGRSHLHLADVNANGQGLEARLVFDAPPLATVQNGEATEAGEPHFWLPAAPSCRVSAQITLRGAQNGEAEEIAFTGQGYHDHNWGRLLFDSHLKDWYWARAGLGRERTVLLYYVRRRSFNEATSHLLMFEAGRLLLHEPNAPVWLSHFAVNGFGTIYATRLTVDSEKCRVQFDLQTRLDSAPFYLRVLCDAAVTREGVTETGQGIGEYFRPRMLSWPVVASATKARIVAR